MLIFQDWCYEQLPFQVVECMVEFFQSSRPLKLLFLAPNTVLRFQEVLLCSYKTPG